MARPGEVQCTSCGGTDTVQVKSRTTQIAGNKTAELDTYQCNQCGIVFPVIQNST